MAVARTGSPVDIAISGLRAESTRMKVIANNIANAKTTRTPSGGPYRRRQVALATSGEPLGGVQVDGVLPDLTTDFKQIYDPGSPAADKDGMVLLPNVDLPVELINLVTASRAYQANAAVLKRYQDMVNATLELLR